MSLWVIWTEEVLVLQCALLLDLWSDDLDLVTSLVNLLVSL